MGFLHTGATFTADLNLIVQLAMGVALLAGMRLARLRRFRAHAYCQGAVMLLNLVMIALVMLPSYRQQVAPNLNRVTGDAYYGVAVAHAALGTIAEVLGLYVVLVAFGARIVPKALRFRNYRAWMRATLFLWWIVIGFGIGTYVVWYMLDSGEVATQPVPTSVPPPAAGDTAPAQTPPPDAKVVLDNFNFTPKELTIPAGTTVVFTNSGGRHTVETPDGFLQSDTLIGGQSYQKRFDKPGTYDYFCGNHGAADGSGMAGRIIVTAK